MRLVRRAAINSAERTIAAMGGQAFLHRTITDRNRRKEREHPGWTLANSLYGARSNATTPVNWSGGQWSFCTRIEGESPADERVIAVHNSPVVAPLAHRTGGRHATGVACQPLADSSALDVSGALPFARQPKGV
jgi:hypothetical protein